MKAKKRIRDIVYHVIVFGIGILMIYPLIWMFMSSFKETKTIFQTAGSLIPNPFTLDNYINGLKGFAKVPTLPSSPSLATTRQVAFLRSGTKLGSLPFSASSLQ